MLLQVNDIKFALTCLEIKEVWFFSSRKKRMTRQKKGVKNSFEWVVCRERDDGFNSSNFVNCVFSSVFFWSSTYFAFLVKFQSFMYFKSNWNCFEIWTISYVTPQRTWCTKFELLKFSYQWMGELFAMDVRRGSWKVNLFSPFSTWDGLINAKFRQIINLARIYVYQARGVDFNKRTVTTHSYSKV